MDICKALDLAIMQTESAKDPSIKAGYCVGGKIYENYLSNVCWDAFKKNMEQSEHLSKAFKAYSKGGGKEMDERKVRGEIYPPKMASFGSSSRMIFNLMKGCPEFAFEKKLPTVVGGVANLDGYFETEGKRIFVEAKCREPYASKFSAIASVYSELFEYLSKSPSVNLNCIIGEAKEKGKISAKFTAGDVRLEHFDIKQMICHLLGIANDCLNCGDPRAIEFIYLLYNPTDLKFSDPKEKEKIMKIYDLECSECAAVDFNGLFLNVLNFLQKYHEKGKDKNISDIAKNFSFRMCDQNTMRV